MCALRVLNVDYSLTEARENFKKYYTIYRWNNPSMYYQTFEKVIELKRKIIDIIELTTWHPELTTMKKQLRTINSDSWKKYRKQEN